MKFNVRQALSVGLRGLGVVINGGLTILLFWYALFAWILRDGLGPDSVESTGAEAWQRWREGMGEVIIPALVVFGAGILCCRMSHWLDPHPLTAKKPQWWQLSWWLLSVPRLQGTDIEEHP